VVAGFYKTVLTQMLEALKFVHGNGIIHRHISPHNIVYNDEQPNHLTVFVLTDFSFAARTHPAPREHCGALQYMAPEVFEKQKQTTAIDIWSLGILALNMLLRLPLPHPSYCTFDGMRRYQWCDYMIQLAQHCQMPEVERMVRMSANDRVTASDLLEALSAGPSDPIRRLPANEQLVHLFIKTQLGDVGEAAEAELKRLRSMSQEDPLATRFSRGSVDEASFRTIPTSSEAQTSTSRRGPSGRGRPTRDVEREDSAKTEPSIQHRLPKGSLDRSPVSTASVLAPKVQSIVEPGSVAIPPPTLSGEIVGSSSSASAAPVSSSPGVARSSGLISTAASANSQGIAAPSTAISKRRRGSGASKRKAKRLVQQEEATGQQAASSAQPQPNVRRVTPEAVGRSKSVESPHLASSSSGSGLQSGGFKGEKQSSVRKTEQTRSGQKGDVTAQQATNPPRLQANVNLSAPEAGGHDTSTESPQSLKIVSSGREHQGMARKGEGRVQAPVRAPKPGSAPESVSALEPATASEPVRDSGTTSPRGKDRFQHTPESAAEARLVGYSEENNRALLRCYSTPVLAARDREIYEALVAIRARETTTISDISGILETPAVVGLPRNAEVTKAVTNSTAQQIARALEIMKGPPGRPSREWPNIFRGLAKLPIDFSLVLSIVRDHNKAREQLQSASRNTERSENRGGGQTTMRRGASVPALSATASPWDPGTGTLSPWGQIYLAYKTGGLPPPPPMEDTDSERYQAWTEAGMPPPPLGPHPETIIYEIWAHTRVHSARFGFQEILDDEARKYRERFLGSSLRPLLPPPPPPESEDQIYRTWMEGRLPPSPPMNSTPRQAEHVWTRAGLLFPRVHPHPESEIYDAWAQRRLPHPPMPFPVGSYGEHDRYKGWTQAKQSDSAFSSPPSNPQARIYQRAPQARLRSARSSPTMSMLSPSTGPSPLPPRRHPFPGPVIQHRQVENQARQQFPALISAEQISEARARVGSTAPRPSLLPSPSTSFLSTLPPRAASQRTELQARMTAFRPAEAQGDQEASAQARLATSRPSLPPSHSAPVQAQHRLQSQSQPVKPRARQTPPRRAEIEDQQVTRKSSTHGPVSESPSQRVQRQSGSLPHRGAEAHGEQVEHQPFRRLPHPRGASTENRQEENLTSKVRHRIDEAQSQSALPLAILPPSTRAEVESRRRGAIQRPPEDARRQREETEKQQEDTLEQQEEDERGWQQPRQRGFSRRTQAQGQGRQSQTPPRHAEAYSQQDEVPVRLRTRREEVQELVPDEAQGRPSPSHSPFTSPSSAFPSPPCPLPSSGESLRTDPPPWMQRLFDVMQRP